MFRDREDAAHLLVQRLKSYRFHAPVVLAIPRGGVVTGAVLARELGAELDVVLSRKLRAQYQPELAIGAVAEDGQIYVESRVREALELTDEYLSEEQSYQLGEIERRKRLFRTVRSRAPVKDRSVIVTDDGIATGSTMIAALQTVKAQKPHELIVAVPVAPFSRLAEIRRRCDDVVCVLAPVDFWAIGQFYEDFPQIEDAEVISLLRANVELRRTEDVASPTILRS